MRRRHSRDELLQIAVQVCVARGLAGLTYASVAEAADVPDRTVVYYFPTKDELVTTVIDAMVQGLRDRLEPTLATDRQSPDALLRAAWRQLKTPESRAVMRVWLELCVLATDENSGVYGDAARGLADTWLDWLAQRVDEPTPARRRQRAAVLLARLDGALLLDLIGRPEAARRALRG